MFVHLSTLHYPLERALESDSVCVCVCVSMCVCVWCLFEWERDIDTEMSVEDISDCKKKRWEKELIVLKLNVVFEFVSMLSDWLRKSISSRVLRAFATRSFYTLTPDVRIMPFHFKKLLNFLLRLVSFYDILRISLYGANGYYVHHFIAGKIVFT